MLEVIIVDDEPTVRRGLRTTVPWADHGYVVTGEAANGQEALELLASGGADLVISDIRMPGMDGLELAERIRALLGRTRVVLLTGHEDFGYARRALRAGVVEYLLKPVDVGELCALLDRLKAEMEEEGRRAAVIDSVGPEIERRLFETLFLGGGATEVALRAETAALGIDAGQGPFVLLIASPDRKSPGHAQGEASKPSLPSMVAQGFALWGGESAAYVLTIPGGMTPEELAREAAAAMAEECRRSGGGSWSFASSREWTAGLADLASAYARASACLEGRFLLGPARYHEEPPPPSRLQMDVQGLAGFQRARAMIESGETERAAFAINDLASELAALAARREEALEAARRLKSLAEASAARAAEDPLRAPEAEDHALEAARTLWDLRDSLKEAVFSVLSTGDGTRYSLLVRKARELARRRLAEESLVTKIADSLRVSPNHLSRKFKEETGETLSDYARRVRLEEARRLIAESDLKLFEIAEEIGMSDYKYFVESFKKAFGLRPSDLRRPGASQ